METMRKFRDTPWNCKAKGIMRRCMDTQTARFIPLRDAKADSITIPMHTTCKH